MKIFIILICTLPFIAAQKYPSPRCPKPPVQAKFEIEKYMGMWFPVKAACAIDHYDSLASMYMVFGNGTSKSKHFDAYIYKKLKDGSTMETRFRLSGSKPGKAKFASDPMYYDKNFKEFHSQHWILHIGNHVAVVYGCNTDALPTETCTWILSRADNNPSDRSGIRKAEDLVKSYFTEWVQFKTILPPQNPAVGSNIRAPIPQGP